MNILEVKNLTKMRDGFCLNQISLELPEGYIMGYAGQNGAGKTTTLELIMGFLKPDQGEIRVAGRTYREDPVGYTDQIGYITDESYLLPDIKVSVLEKLMAQFYPSFRPEVFRDYLKRWEIRDQKIRQCSKGMKLRIMFAAVLARDTRLLILDEATSGLDPVMRMEILGLLQDYIADGKRSVLFSTHIINDLERIADYLCLIDQGELIINSTVSDLLEDYVTVKGGQEEWNGQLEQYLEGAVRSEVGFKGLLKAQYLDELPKNMLTERPTLEQIMVDTLQERRRRRI